MSRSPHRVSASRSTLEAGCQATRSSTANANAVAATALEPVRPAALLATLRLMAAELAAAPSGPAGQPRHPEGITERVTAIRDEAAAIVQQLALQRAAPPTRAEDRDPH